MMQNRGGARRTLWLAAAALTLTAQSAVAQARPTPQQITDRYVQAIGGRAVLQRLSARHQVAEMSMPAVGMTMTVESFQARPNLILTKVDMPGMGTMTMGYDGTVAWSNNPMQGARLLTGAELSQTLQQADFDATMDFQRSFPTMETVGEREVGGRSCWNVRMVHTTGIEVHNCFDKETGLLAGAIVKQVSQMGEVEANVTFDDYKEFDGMRMPARVTTSVMGQEMVLTVKSVSHAPIDASVFQLPAEIRALTPASND